VGAEGKGRSGGEVFTLGCKGVRVLQGVSYYLRTLGGCRWVYWVIRYWLMGRNKDVNVSLGALCVVMVLLKGGFGV
jgi:hypothetical protein